MKQLLATLALAITASAACAHGKVDCPAVPKEDKKPHAELQRKLEADGWKVRQVKDYKGCYEVYGMDDKGTKVEAFFHPTTFSRVLPEASPPKPAK